MHWLGYNDAVSWLNEAKIRIFQPIDRLSYWAWRCITLFIDHAIQIYVGQKDNANQWKVMVLKEFLHTVLPRVDNG